MWLIGMFGWVDFKEDGKKIRENGRENIFGGFLVGGRRGKKNLWGSGIFSPSPPKCFLPKMGRKLGRDSESLD